MIWNPIKELQFQSLPRDDPVVRELNYILVTEVSTDFNINANCYHLFSIYIIPGIMLDALYV